MSGVSSLYRALLRLYPASFREEYAPELARTAEEARREHGRLGAMFAAIGDVVPNALALHREILMQDLRYTARSLTNAKGFAIATVLITALGVGANTATFSVADFVLVRPLPFPDANNLVRICEGPRTGAVGWGCGNQLSPANWRDVRAWSRSFTSIGVFTGGAVNLTGAGEPVRVPAVQVSPNLLSVIGVPPMVGRTFDSTATTDADPGTVVVGYGLWQSQFGSDPGIIGKTVSLDGTPRVVIGIMPQHFRFPTEDVQLWIPLTIPATSFENRQNNYLDGVARLRPGVTFEQARTELNGIADRITRETPDLEEAQGFSFFRQRDQLSPRYRMILLALCGASLCMLLLTCANLANLMLVRAVARERELAVRAALGAGRERLVRQMLTESVLLAVTGGIAGAIVAAVTVPLLSSLVPSSLPIASQPSVDQRVFAFALAFAVLTGLGFGLIPALRVGGRTGFAALRQGARSGGGRGASRLRSTLVAVEVGVSVVLLISSGLLIRAIWQVQAVNPGFRTESVITLRTALASPVYRDSVRREQFLRDVTAGVRSLAGVEGAAYTSGLPMVLTGGITGITIPGVELRGNRAASLRLVTPGFFETLEIPVLRGRDVADSDTRDRQLVAVVSESFANRFWPDQDPIGREFETRGDRRIVVGVVADIRVRGLERTSEPQLYLPAYQPPLGIGDLYQPKDLVVRTSRPDPGLVAAIRRVVRQADPQQPVSNVRLLSEVVGDQTAMRRAQINVLGALAVLALVLTAVGIHGLLAFTVSQRDREIGVRLALGASPRSVARMIIGQGMRIAVVGVVPGVLVAWLAARSMSALLVGVPPEDPLTIAAVAALCFVTTVAACARPAFRAAGVHPIAALKSE
jgi:putative ABC transport system permease protein